MQQVENLNMLAVRLSDLRIFLVVAKHENYSRAAKELFITPSQVSKVISRLEQLWAVDLFIHRRNAIELTPAGAYLAEHLTDKMREIEDAITKGTELAKSHPDVSLGFSSLSSPSEVSPGLALFRKRYPERRVSLGVRGSCPALWMMLAKHDADIIYTSDVDAMPLPEGFVWKPLVSTPIYAAVNHEHQLAGEEEMSFSKLKDFSFIEVAVVDDKRQSYLRKICSKVDFIPTVTMTVQDTQSAIMEVAVNPNIVHIESSKIFDFGVDLRIWELPGISWTMGLVYREDAPRPVLDLADCLKETMSHRR